MDIETLLMNALGHIFYPISLPAPSIIVDFTFKNPDHLIYPDRVLFETLKRTYAQILLDEDVRAYLDENVHNATELQFCLQSIFGNAITPEMAVALYIRQKPDMAFPFENIKFTFYLLAKTQASVELRCETNSMYQLFRGYFTKIGLRMGYEILIHDAIAQAEARVGNSLLALDIGNYRHNLEGAISALFKAIDKEQPLKSRPYPKPQDGHGGGAPIPPQTEDKPPLIPPPQGLPPEPKRADQHKPPETDIHQDPQLGQQMGGEMPPEQPTRDSEKESQKEDKPSTETPPPSPDSQQGAGKGDSSESASPSGAESQTDRDEEERDSQFNSPNDDAGSEGIDEEFMQTIEDKTLEEMKAEKQRLEQAQNNKRKQKEKDLNELASSLSDGGSDKAAGEMNKLDKQIDKLASEIDKKANQFDETDDEAEKNQIAQEIERLKKEKANAESKMIDQYKRSADRSRKQQTQIEQLNEAVDSMDVDAVKKLLGELSEKDKELYRDIVKSNLDIVEYSDAITRLTNAIETKKASIIPLPKTLPALSRMVKDLAEEHDWNVIEKSSPNYLTMTIVRNDRKKFVIRATSDDLRKKKPLIIITTEAGQNIQIFSVDEIVKIINSA